MSQPLCKLPLRAAAGQKHTDIRRWYIRSLVDGAFFTLLGLFAMSRSRTRRRIGDRGAGTVVIRD